MDTPFIFSQNLQVLEEDHDKDSLYVQSLIEINSFHSFQLEEFIKGQFYNLSNLYLSANFLKKCPLRLILLFLSATLAGFFILKNLKSQPETHKESINHPLEESESSIPRSTKVFTAIGLGFWTCVDMASGHYLWRHFASSKKS